MRNVVAAVEHPTQWARVVGKGPIKHDLVNVIEMIIFALGKKLQICVIWSRGVPIHPRLVKLGAFTSSDAVMGVIQRIVTIVDKINCEPISGIIF